jgi:hypothetical protein
MSVSSAPEPPNVYFALGSISGKTFVNDAAASTVGTDPRPLDVVVAGAELDVAAGCEAVELELLLPQPTASADTAIAITAAEIPQAEFALTNRNVSYVRTPESWHPN